MTRGPVNQSTIDLYHGLVSLWALATTTDGYVRIWARMGLDAVLDRLAEPQAIPGMIVIFAVAVYCLRAAFRKRRDKQGKRGGRGGKTPKQRI